MFEIDDIVLYPSHGVAIIDDVIEKKVLREVVKFFNLRLLYKDTKILIPVKSIENSSIRYLSSKSEIDIALNNFYTIAMKKIKFPLDVSPSGWNKRNKEYLLKIQIGDLAEMLEIYNDLHRISNQKELSFGEKKVLHLVEDLISEEVQTVRKISKDEILLELRFPFKQFAVSDSENIEPVSTLS